MREVLSVVAIAAIVVAGVGLFMMIRKLKAKYITQAIQRHNEANGTSYAIAKIGMPPVRLWINNRKGDSWALVKLPDGKSRWARLRSRGVSGDPLAFFEA
jgi:hypothetical protein